MKLTPSQRIIFDLLEDGYPHTKDELRLLLKDEFMEDHTLTTHISNLRNKINRDGFDIVTRSSRYQLVRLLHSAYDGRR